MGCFFLQILFLDTIHMVNAHPKRMKKVTFKANLKMSYSFSIKRIYFSMLTNLIPQMCFLEVTMAEKYLSCGIKFKPVLENRFVFFIIEFFTMGIF